METIRDYPKLIKISKYSYYICISPEIRKLLKLKRNQMVQIIATKDKLIIKKMK